MAESTRIKWTDATFNPWWGCTEVSPGCANCYAREWSALWGRAKWGKGQARRQGGERNWNEPRRWDRKAAQAGRFLSVFCASMADVFDPEVPPEWRDRLWELIFATPNLRWLLLTKRPEHARGMLPVKGIPGNAGLGVSVESAAYHWRVEEALSLPFPFHFVSAEPALGPLDLGPTLKYLGPYTHRHDAAARRVGWVILGGESGSGARACLQEWIRDGLDACQAARVPCFVKQLGAAPCVEERGVRIPLSLVHKKGEEPAEWPPWLRVQQFPWGADGKTLWGRQAG